uniref:HD domain-containing protein 2 n=1 Tax=Cacopsylla melanoneura TaxID=428564 RepID=A0A8D9FJ28_9HEMI
MSDTAANYLTFLGEMGKLKHIKRTGWVLRNVNDPETISGHMYRMAVMTFLLEDNNELNRTRCMELALLHDMAECIVGDLTPYCGVSKEEKHRREDEAMKTLKSLCHKQGERMYTLFQVIILFHQ